MDITSYLSGHGWVGVPREGGKGKCGGPEKCPGCISDAALLTLKNHYKEKKILDHLSISVLVNVLILGNKSIWAEQDEDGRWVFLGITTYNSTYAFDHKNTFDILAAMEKKGFKWQMTMANGVAFTHEAGKQHGRGYRPGYSPMDVCLAALEALGYRFED